MTGLTEFLGGQVLDAAWDAAKRRILKKRLDRARKLLIDELERGSANLTDIEDIDEAAAMVFEYADAAERGTARRNLKMMAQVIAGLLGAPPIYADNFLRWSRVLADLTQLELITLATFYKRLHVLEESPGAEAAAPALRHFNRVRDDLVIAGISKSTDDVKATLQSLGRHGLIVQGSGYGTMIYSAGPALHEIMRLIRIEEILSEPAR